MVKINYQLYDKPSSKELLDDKTFKTMSRQFLWRYIQSNRTLLKAIQSCVDGARDRTADLYKLNKKASEFLDTHLIACRRLYKKMFGMAYKPPAPLAYKLMKIQIKEEQEEREKVFVEAKKAVNAEKREERLRRMKAGNKKSFTK